jgi:hypothetical protein
MVSLRLRIRVWHKIRKYDNLSSSANRNFYNLRVVNSSHHHRIALFVSRTDTRCVRRNVDLSLPRDVRQTLHQVSIVSSLSSQLHQQTE